MNKNIIFHNTTILLYINIIYFKS